MCPSATEKGGIHHCLHEKKKKIKAAKEDLVKSEVFSLLLFQIWR